MSDAINPLEREGCWLCGGCGEIESTGAIGARETVGCPVCVQNDNEYHAAGDAMEDAADKALERANQSEHQAQEKK